MIRKFVAKQVNFVMQTRRNKVSIAALVKQLREETGSPMLQCKKALEENNSDFEAAKEYLKQKGLSNAGKYSSKETREGIVGIRLSEDSKSAALLELNCQTDFVARTDSFLKFSSVFLDSLLQNQSGKNFELISEEEIKAFSLQNKLNEQVLPQAGAQAEIAEVQKYLISHLQENINLRRCAHLIAANGLFGSYVHNTLASNIGMKSCLVELDFSKSNEISQEKAQKLKELADNLALQILGNKPEFLTKNDIPQTVLEQEIEQAKNELGSKLEGKPEKVQSNMIEGKLKKFYEDKVLYCQSFIFDEEDGKSVEQYIKEIEKQVGDKVSISKYYTWSCQ